MGASRERLLDDGFSDDEIERIFDHVPVATHNQRGLGTLHIGCPEGCRHRDRGAHAARHRRGLDVVGDLRADEALRRGRRRREGPPPPALRRGLRARDDRRRRRRSYPELSDEHFVSARQENLETIHQHNVVAERFGLLGELRHELATGEHAAASRRRCASGSTPPAADGRPASLTARPAPSRRGLPLLGLAQHAPQPEEVVDPADDRDRDGDVDEPVDPRRRRVEAR